jgi:hypothetical protein
MALQFNNEEMSVEQKLALLEAEKAVLNAEIGNFIDQFVELSEQKCAKKKYYDLQLQQQSGLNEAKLTIANSESEYYELVYKIHEVGKEMDVAQLKLKLCRSQEEVYRTQEKLRKMTHCDMLQQDAYTVAAENFAVLQAEHDELAATINDILSSRN